MATSTLEPLALLLSDSRGIHIPRDFVTGFDLSRWEGIDPRDIEYCKDPDCESYWDAWSTILDNASFTENGHTWLLSQDGDLWAYCAELMSWEEQKNFGLEPDDEEFEHEEITCRDHLADLQLTDVQKNDVMHVVHHRFNPENWQSVRDRIKECYNRPSDVDLKLTALNEILEGHGVESFEHKGCRYEYINQGDTYDCTIIYSDESNEFFVASYGDVAES